MDIGASFAGVSSLAVRDFLRRHRDPSTVWHQDCLARRLELSSEPERVRRVLDELVRHGYVAPSDPGGPNGQLWSVAESGLRFANARGGPKLRRAAADALMAKLVARCAAANGEPRFAHWVARLSVFGSYLTDVPLLGDLDIVVDLEPKEDDVDKQMALGRARWRAARTEGRRVSEDALYSWSSDEVLRFVRQRNGYVKISPREDLVRLSIEARVVFERR
jgi:hypothetical protein